MGRHAKAPFGLILGQNGSTRHQEGLSTPPRPPGCHVRPTVDQQINFLYCICYRYVKIPQNDEGTFGEFRPDQKSETWIWMLNLGSGRPNLGFGVQIWDLEVQIQDLDVHIRD